MEERQAGCRRLWHGPGNRSWVRNGSSGDEPAVGQGSHGWWIFVAARKTELSIRNDQ